LTVAPVAAREQFDECLTYEIRLDGKKIGETRNLRNPDTIVKTENLGSHQLAKGEHRMRFVCVGRDPASIIREAGEPGFYFGLDKIYLRKVFPHK
jgi:hypothetical protein